MQVHPTTKQRVLLWLKIDFNGPIPEYRPDLGPCWLWTGCVDRDGYGQHKIRPRQYKAHQVVYEVVYACSKLPGYQYDHLCRVHRCVNPTHLEPVTPKENSERSAPATKLLCKRGHPFDYWNGKNRYCRACNAEHHRRYRSQSIAS